MNNIALGEIIYILHPKEYQIQPLFYGKMVIKPNIYNNPYTMDTLQGIARQITDTLSGSGDFKNLIEYF